MGQLLNDVTAMRALLDDPSHWMQGNYANHLNGELSDVVWADHSTAFCSVGAAYKVIGMQRVCAQPPAQFYRAHLVLRLLHQLSGGPSLVRWNDDPTRTHNDVLALLDKAIQHLEPHAVQLHGTWTASDQRQYEKFYQQQHAQGGDAERQPPATGVDQDGAGGSALGQGQADPEASPCRDYGDVDVLTAQA